MGAFNYNSEDMFGNYAVIEQHRFGADNAMYLHKVVGSLKSNSYVDVPVVSPATETVHDQIVDVVACICCGVGEREVRRYRLSDVEINHNSEIARLREENERLVKAGKEFDNCVAEFLDSESAWREEEYKHYFNQIYPALQDFRAVLGV